MEMTVLYDTIKVSLFSQFGKIETVAIDSIMDIYLDLVK